MTTFKRKGGCTIPMCTVLLIEFSYKRETAADFAISHIRHIYHVPHAERRTLIETSIQTSHEYNGKN